MSPLRLARLSSARRHLPGRWLTPARLILFLVGALLLLVAIVELPRRPQSAPERPKPPAAAVRVQATLPAPSPTPSPSPSPPSQSSAWVEVTTPLPAPTPEPWPTSEPEPTRPAPAPTPQPTDCVEATWSATQGVMPLNQVVVEIELSNRCPRDLEPLDVWVRVAGYREGALVQTACGHPFQTVYQNHGERVTIGLPGSLDWYDRLEVELAGPGCS